MMITSCVTRGPTFGSAEIIKNLQDTVYHLPAKKNKQAPVIYQSLRRFDLIFVGYDIERLKKEKKWELINMLYLIPGHFTHVLVYLGKDHRGNAYAVEVNGNENVNLTLTLEGLKADAKLRILCLGKDHTMTGCRDKGGKHGLKSYDYRWAKRLRPKLRKQLLRHEKRLIQAIRDDLRSDFAFQIPLNIRLDTLQKKVIPLVNDGRKNGADCVDYFISLFEEEAHVCMHNTYMCADEIMRYFTQDPQGRKATIPEKYNFVTHKTIRIHDFIKQQGFQFQDSPSRRTVCKDRRIVHGAATPDRLSHSRDLIDSRAQ
jgi:hypothetical protein